MSKLIDFADLPPRAPEDYNPRTVGQLTPKGIQLFQNLSSGIYAMSTYQRRTDFFGRPLPEYEYPRAGLLEAMKMNALTVGRPFLRGLARDFHAYLADITDPNNLHIRADLDIRRDAAAHQKMQRPRAATWHPDSSGEVCPYLVMYFIGGARSEFNTHYRSVCDPTEEGMAPHVPEDEVRRVGRYEVVEMLTSTQHRSAPHFEKLTGDWEWARVQTSYSRRRPTTPTFS